MDGWKATRNAWKFLFSSVVIICCFLHVFIKIRDRAKKKYKDIFDEAASKLWDCYYAENKIAFSHRIRRLVEWCKKNNMPSVIANPINAVVVLHDPYKKKPDYIGFWGGLRYPPKEAEMQRLCNQQS